MEGFASRPWTTFTTCLKIFHFVHHRNRWFYGKSAAAAVAFYTIRALIDLKLTINKPILLHISKEITEYNMHRKFGHLRSHTQCFKASKDLMTSIDDLKKRGNKLSDEIPHADYRISNKTSGNSWSNVSAPMQK